MIRCAGCGADLENSLRSRAETLGDCHPLCGDCMRTAGRRVRPTRQTLVRSLFTAGRTVSRCQACSAEGRTEFHFLVPLVRGGAATSGNLLVLCPVCHRKVHQGARLVLHLNDCSDLNAGEASDEPTA